MSASSGSNHANADAGRRANGESSPTKSPACFSNDFRTTWSWSLVLTVVGYENCGITRSPSSLIERMTFSCGILYGFTRHSNRSQPEAW